MAWLTIYEAAEVLALRAGRPATPSAFKHILMAGAECQLRIFWRNSQQRFSCLFGFSGEISGSSAALREMELPSSEIARLESRDEVELFLFEPNDDDWLQLRRLKSVDEEGSPGGFRSLIDGGPARVTRDALLVRDQEVLALARQARHDDGRLRSFSASGPQDGDPEVPPERWSLRKQKIFKGYSAAVYRRLVAAQVTGTAPPTAREMLEEWRANRPPEVFEVMANAIKFYAAGDHTGEANLKAIGEMINRMVKR